MAIVLALGLALILATSILFGATIRSRIDRHCLAIEAYYAAIGERHDASELAAKGVKTDTAQILREEMDIRIYLGSIDSRMRYIITHLQRIDRERA